MEDPEARCSNKRYFLGGFTTKRKHVLDYLGDEERESTEKYISNTKLIKKKEEEEVEVEVEVEVEEVEEIEETLELRGSIRGWRNCWLILVLLGRDCGRTCWVLLSLLLAILGHLI
mgnify:CR=1 FL=1